MADPADARKLIGASSIVALWARGVPPSTALWNLVRVILGAVLLFAAASKTHQLATGPVPASSPVASRFLLSIFVGCELAVAFALLASIPRRLLRTIAILWFFGLLAASIFQVMQNVENCGCFGQFRANPKVMAVFNLAALAAVWFLAPAHPAAQLFTKRRAVVFGAIFLGLVGVSTVSINSFSPKTISSDGELSPGTTVVLNPDEWIGGRFGLAKHIDVGDQLLVGSWTLVFHRHDCARCRYEIEKLTGNAPEQSTSLALVEVPPFGPETARESLLNRDRFLLGRLGDHERWFVETPLVIQIENGIVTTASGSRSDIFEVKRIASHPLPEAASQALPPFIQVGNDSGPAYGFPNYRRAKRDYFLGQIACGPLSLLAVLKALGVPVEYTAEQALLGSAGTTGMDMLQLKTLAESFGLYALGITTSPSELRRIALPAIVHVNQHSFIAVVGYDATGLRVIPPASSPVLIANEELEKQLGRQTCALLLSKAPIRLVGNSSAEFDPNPRSGLRPAKTVLSVGYILHPHWEREFVLYNPSSKTTEIKNIKATCGCVEAEPERRHVLAGETVSLRVRGKQERVGYFSHGIVVTTDIGDALTIPLHGYLDTPIFIDPPATSVTTTEHQSGSAEIPLEIADNVDASNLSAILPKDAPFGAAISKPREGKPALRLEWPGFEKPGTFRFVVRIALPGWPAELACRYFVAFHVLPKLDVFPAAVRILDEELRNGNWKRQLSVRAANGAGTWKCSWVGDTASQLLSFEVVDKQADSRLIVIGQNEGIDLSRLAGRSFVVRLIASNASAGAKVVFYFGPGAFDRPGETNQERSVP